MVKKVDAKNAERKIQEALEILKELGFPRQQQNERSALTLFALLHLKPNNPWKDANNPLIGITPMMEFFDKHYGKRYAPNTRETEVWIAESPTHLIHFNGERFLGPYED